MSTPKSKESIPPLPIGALLRFALYDIRQRIYAGVVAAGFDDVQPAHVTLFRWPGPDGRRPSEVAADARLSKQAVSDLLGDLERLGYLERRPDPTDARARIIHLTSSGRRLHEVAVAVHAQIEEEWSAAVGQRRYQELREALGQLVSGAEG